MRKFILSFSLIFIFAAISEAVIIDGAIRGKSGFSYSSIAYGFDSVSVTIKNSSQYNRDFGGTMLFLDKNYKVIARAELLKARIKRHSSRKYKAFFSEGTGEDAKHARYLEWEF
ncbi:MAG: hypothetical protein IJ859_08700 [Synergistaceae bacterium]|nr:hypothetical protein [Synergistaceae bacterium]